MTSEHDFLPEFRGDEPRKRPSIWSGRSDLAWAAAGAIIVVGLAVMSTCSAHGSTFAPSYLGIQGGPSWALNSNQDDKYEARSQAAPSIAGFVGWSITDWLDVQATARWLHQEAHGFNHGGYEESVDGDMDAGLLTVGPVVKWPGLPVTPYLRLGIGPAYRDIDMSTSSQTRTRVQKSGVVAAFEGAAGIEQAMNDDWSVRLEGGCQYADPMESCGASVGLVFRWGE